ncbi:hypothetical protein [Frigoribacterium sp. RIT-PI-h]|uniref:hypothetical protein n=1 Tax=Frigoribacterium sp. RIT-PI-h TaxID=1690245 RepID=UPI000A8A7F25|nr:hypothetical protein [Frigoribacterium sp. RIT-PI-h]
MAPEVAGRTVPSSFWQAGIGTIRSRGKLTPAMFVWSSEMWTSTVESFLPAPELARWLAASSNPSPSPSRVSVPISSRFTSPVWAVSCGTGDAVDPSGPASLTVGDAPCSTCHVAMAATDVVLTRTAASAAAVTFATTAAGCPRRRRPWRAIPPSRTAPPRLAAPSRASGARSVRPSSVMRAPSAIGGPGGPSRGEA